MYLKPVSEIKADLGIQLNGPVNAYFTDTCAKHMDKYIPKDIGNLRNNISKEVDSVTYESPYAHAQYVGIVHERPVTNYTTPRHRTLLGQKDVECRRGTSSKRGTRLCQ